MKVLVVALAVVIVVLTQCFLAECDSHKAISILCCKLQQDSSTAAATHPPVSGGYSTFSCTPCDKGQYEVHVINIYEPTGSSRGFRQEPTNVVTVPVEIKSQKAVDIKLVFINYEAAHWVITKPSYINILAVNVVAYYHTSTTVRLSSNINSTLSVEKVRDYYSGWREICEVQNYVINKYGYMSSFTGVYESSSFVLSVGTCDALITSTVSNTDAQSCLQSNNCWLKYKFRYDDNWNSCYGDQYVTLFKQHYYIGVILCSSKRYKIFMSESLSEKFLNIGDSGGHGQDHCEFVGAASEAGVACDSNFWKSPSTTGYFRYKWGQKIQKGNIGGHPKWTGKYYGKWCECGVAIPGTKQVMNYVGTGTLSVKSTTTSYLTTPFKKSTTAVTWKETEGGHVNFAIPILSCELQQDSSIASATHPPVSGGYSTFSCTPCDKGQYEVHVINIYEPTGSNRGFRQGPTNVVTVPVEIKSQKAVDIKLVFINYEAAHWVITKPSYVNILAVNVVAYYHTFTTVRLSNNINSTLSVEKVHDYHSGWREICKVQNYVINKYGYMSSFTGVYQSSSFVLTVGTCDASTTTTVDPSTINCTKCLSRKDCWLKYQFSYDNNWNDCHGDQYVTMYQQYYVGVVICTNAKYKIFISESLTGRYLNVGDEESFSRNHCEFVGAASESMADHFYQGSRAPNVTGYYRSTWGANILKGEIGGTSRWGIYYVKYYECGVCIPGSKIVVDFNGADSCLTSMSTSMSTVTSTVSNTDAQSCLRSNNCWLKYKFRYDDNWNSCFGDQYVTLFKQHYYIGVILCSSKRYKIFMSESLLEKFLNIGDGNGHGKDHCEFVGAASEAGVDCDSNFWKSPSTTGYYRSKWGQIIQKGNIGGHPQWTGKYYGKWCECGVAIPGTKQVMNYVGTGTLSVKSTTTSYLTTPIKKSTTAVTWKETEGNHVNFVSSTVSNTDAQSCLRSNNCWLKYKFRYEDNWNSCFGDQYVTLFKQHYYIGVILCSSKRYKIFMSESLLEKFLNIGDGNGHGKDHCEFVGAASEAGVDCDSNFWKSPSTTGYYRSKWGQIIQKGNIGGHPQWTGKYYGKWCECGIAIPGTKQVMNYVGTGTLSVKSTTTSYLTTPIKKSTTAVTWKETEGSHVNFAIPILSCELQQDSSTAAATHPPVSGGYSTFSCTPCDKGQYEVHVINIYEPTGSSRGFRQEPTNVVTVPVEIKSQKAVDIKLVFINYEAAHWVITKPSYVNILAVNLVAYYHTSTTVRLSNNINSTLSVEKVHDYYSGWKEICKVQNYVINKYGYMSSFTGVYKSSSFVLTVGTCDVSTTTTVDPSTIDCTKCLSRKDCWLKYQFSYDNNWNDCHGDQYVTMYQQYYVGVVVCTNAKYKIFISESLTGRYLNVGDEKSFSRNHCEFVGAASEAMADHFYQGSPAPNVTGYYRSTWGANILKGEIGGTHRWGIYYVKYYECGVCIPGSKIVVDFNDADSCLTSMSTSMSTGDATSADLIACRVKQIGGKKMKPGDMFKRKCPGNYKCKVKGPVVIIDGQKNKIKYCDIPFEFPNEGMACKIEYDNGATATLKKCPEDWSCSAGPFDGTDSQYYVCIPDEANGKLKLKHHIEAQLINRACRVGTKVKKSCPDNEPCDGAIITVCDKKAQFCRGPGDEGFSYLKLYSIRAQD